MARRKHIASGVALALLVGVGAYGTLDAYDVVPGVLTLEPDNQPKAVTVHGTTYEPLQRAAQSPSLPASVHGNAPSAQTVKKAMDAALKNPWLGSPTALTVRDADTGAVLYDHDASKATTPASVTKLASAFAITHSKLGLDQRLTTRAMLSGSTLQLVAGGDMALGADAGDPTAIAGRAGLGDLAAQTAAQLKKAGQTSVTLDTNTSYAPGPATAKGWEADLLAAGFTARISTLALASDRADNMSPAAVDPTKNAAEAFIKALGKRGIKATYHANVTTAPSGQTVGSVQSATVLDLLGLALQDSDNSMVESLARQTAASEGVHGDSTAVGSWVTGRLKAQGVNVSGMKLADTSGLSQGTTLPVRILGDILTRGTTGKDPAYQEVIGRLPLAAWNGTLHDRYMRPESQAGAGLVRAKTGSLTGVSSLAGEVQTAGNHRLVFAVSTNGTFSEGPLGAKTAIDAMATSLSALK